MLIRFSVENFLSFRDEVELSMISGKSRKHPEHIIAGETNSKTNILKSAVIYGANASGKSNLIKAMAFAKKTITTGSRLRQTLSVTPFRFDKACEDKPSRFQFEFIYKKKTYIYGFVLDSQRIHNEWLYRVAATTEKQLFERHTDQNGDTKVEFSNINLTRKKDRDFLDFVARGTRQNQLFLTESIERNVSHFQDAYDWFERVLIPIFPESSPAGLEIEFMENSVFQQDFKNFIQLFDTGIAGIELREFNFDEEANIPDELRMRIKNDLIENKDGISRSIIQSAEGGNYLLLRNEQNEVRAWKFTTIHKVKGEDRDVLLDISDESDGTRRLFDLIPALMDLLNRERVFVIDELDRSLHPHLSRSILELFLNNKPEQPSQLIVTTHESSILDLDLLRRDEIWFVEKNIDGVSALYSLEEFAPRYDKDIRKGYLLGRFGAIPFIKNVDHLGWL
jgi:uncharacterized protein